MLFECVALLPDGVSVKVHAIGDRHGARLMHAYRASGRDVLPRLTDHARRMVREQVETAMDVELDEDAPKPRTVRC